MRPSRKRKRRFPDRMRGCARDRLSAGRGARSRQSVWPNRLDLFLPSCAAEGPSRPGYRESTKVRGSPSKRSHAWGGAEVADRAMRHQWHRRAVAEPIRIDTRERNIASRRPNAQVVENPCLRKYVRFRVRWPVADLLDSLMATGRAVVRTIVLRSPEHAAQLHSPTCVIPSGEDRFKAGFEFQDGRLSARY